MLMGARSTAARLVRAPAGSISNNISDDNTVNRLLTVTGVKVVVFVVLVLSSCASMCSSDGMVNEVDALLKFKDSLRNVVQLSSWDPSTNPKPPCSGRQNYWAGVICNDDKILGLRLENMGLTGKIDVDSLGSLPFFRLLSLMNNTFVGSMPNMKMLPNLRSLFLSYNHFSGEIPDDAFKGMNKLRKLYLSDNDFKGKIPSSLASLPILTQLSLDGNKFNGEIPDFSSTRLTMINFADNELEGLIPANLSTFNAAAFLGNEKLCGRPLNACSEAAGPIPVATVETPAKTPVLKIVVIAVLSALVIAMMVAAFIIFRIRSNQVSEKQQMTGLEGNAMSSTTFSSSGQTNRNEYVPPVYLQHQGESSTEADQGHGKMISSTGRRRQQQQAGMLCFIRSDRQRFDLHDLLKASAEILGSAAFGSSYKAAVLDGSQVVVVKRYKQMNNVGREKFHEHMRRIGNLSHPNLLPLVAYYYRKEEKLMLSDFVNNGCLASNLHGNHNFEKPVLNWPTRLSIIKGVARGLAYLHKALPTLVVPHGHLKSSNVLLDESFNPLLTDYALIPVTNTDHAQQQMMPYKSPEYAQLGRITNKTDVWSFGILVLEILTGKFPENYLAHRHTSDSDIATWVNTIVTEKRTSEVFDVEMGAISNSKAEMLKLLKIGLSCCEENVERRLDIKEALEQIEDLKESEPDEEYSHTVIVTSDDGDAYSRAV